MQAAKAPASSLHSKVLLASVDVKLKLALVLLSIAGGLAVMLVSGAVVSIVQVKLAGVGSVLPTASIARTWKVWLPVVSAL